MKFKKTIPILQLIDEPFVKNDEEPIELENLIEAFMEGREIPEDEIEDDRELEMYGFDDNDAQPIEDPEPEVVDDDGTSDPEDEPVEDAGFKDPYDGDDYTPIKEDLDSDGWGDIKHPTKVQVRVPIIKRIKWLKVLGMFLALFGALAVNFNEGNRPLVTTSAIIMIIGVILVFYNIKITRN